MHHGWWSARSVPLEVVELADHVQDFSIEDNPLPVLPSKWHGCFGTKEAISAPPGYTSEEVGP